MARPLSLSRRLLLASLLVLPLYLGLTGFFLDRAHRQSLLAAAEEQLRLHFYNLLGAADWRGEELVVSGRLEQPRYYRFESGLYAQIRDAAGHSLWRSPSLASLAQARRPDTALPALQPGAEQFSHGPTHFSYHYRVLWEDATGGERSLWFSLYHATDQYQAARGAFQRQLLLWLGSAGLFLLGAQLLVLRWGLRPLRSLAADLQRLHSGGERLQGDYPAELGELTRSLDQLLAQERAQRERYRHTLADLAHSLKTPLAVLRSCLAQPEPDRGEMEQQLTRIDRTVSYQLQRSVRAAPAALGRHTPLRPVAERLCRALTKVYGPDAPAFELDIAGDWTFPGDEDDAAELLGNLLDNACKAATSTVRLQATFTDAGRFLQVEDDGPGIPVAQRERLLERGRRGDQYGAGQGIGLAVVADIAASHGGNIDIADSELGGAAIRVDFTGLAGPGA